MKYSSIKDNLRTIKLSSWLGWAMESNWADPFLFAIYSVIRPIASSLILVFMYMVVTGGKTKTELFAYIYIGNAFFMYVYNVLFGISWVIHEDREHYQTIKYIYIAPIRMYYYLFGRGTAKMIITTFAVIIAIAFGMVILKIPVDLGKVNYPLLAHHSWYLTEGIAGIFFLACGAIYPIDILPIWLQYLSKILPLTYWLELLRRAVLGKSLSVTLSYYSNFQLMLIMLVTTAFLAMFSHYIYRTFDHIARRYGRIDQLTNY